MSHVMVQNKGELPIWGMRLLGLSNKDEGQIGQFGTGLKESIALLARLDKLPVIFSGLLRIDFSVETVDGQAEICFRLSENRDRWRANEWHGMGIHPNFGHKDWTDPWMAFREIICNALDASGTEDLHHDVCSVEPKGRAGATRVYIPTSQKILEAYSRVHERLLPLSERTTALATPYGRVLAKRNGLPGLQVFSKGVWIQASPQRSLYDYEIPDLKLNESRSADWYNVQSKMAAILASYTVPQAVVLIEAVIRGELDLPEMSCEPEETPNKPLPMEHRVVCYEQKALQQAAYYMSVDNGASWCQAWEHLFGDNAVMTFNDRHLYDKLTRLGRRPIVVEDDGLRNLLKAAGVPIVTQVLSETDQTFSLLRDPVSGEAKVFWEVWDLLKSLGVTSDMKAPEIKIVRYAAVKTELTFGEYRHGVCYVNEDCLGSRHERMACLEEQAHHISGQKDGSREFQNFLLLISTQLMERVENGDAARL